MPLFFRVNICFEGGANTRCFEQIYVFSRIYLLRGREGGKEGGRRHTHTFIQKIYYFRVIVHCEGEKEDRRKAAHTHTHTLLRHVAFLA